MSYYKKLKKTSLLFRRFVSLTLVFYLFVNPQVNAASQTSVSGGGASELFSLPPELGRLEEFHPGTAPKTIVFIQDAHDILQAQENIAAMVTHFVETRDVKTVYEEGYEGPVPTDELFGKISDPDTRKKIAYYYLDQLRIGGAEYAHINRTREFRLIGADSFKDHFANVDAYAEAVRVQAEIGSNLDDAEKQLENLMRSLGLKPLQSFLKLKKRFEENKKDFVTYLREVCRLYRSAVPGENMELLYPAVTRTLRALDTKQASLLERVNETGANGLLPEMRRLEDALAAALLQKDRDQEIYRYYTSVRLLRRLSKLEVSPLEYQTSKKILDAFRTEDLVHFLVREGKQTAVLSRRWEEDLGKARNFYETAIRRDEKISAALEDFAKLPEEKLAVLVYGGFHAERIRKILEDSGMSYAVVSPQVTHFDERHQEYYRQGMSAGSERFLSGIAPGMARLITLFEMENSGAPAVREKVSRDIQLLGKIMPGIAGDFAHSARTADLQLRQAEKKQVSAPASLRQDFSKIKPLNLRSELRFEDEEEWTEDSALELENTDLERHTDKIVSKLLKHWYRSKTKSMVPEIEALKDRTIRSHPMGTEHYMKAYRDFNEGLLEILEKAAAEESPRLEELRALTQDLFIYHAGIDKELGDRPSRQKFKELYGTDIPLFPSRPGDPFTPTELKSVLAELMANIRHVYPFGAMFFYRLDDDPDYIKYIVRDGGMYSVRAAGVQRSIMGEEYPDESGLVRKHGYHNVIDAVVRRGYGGEVIVQYDKKTERYYSGWFASQPWVRSLNRWVQQFFSFPSMRFRAEIIGRPWMETGVSKIKHKQGLKVVLKIPRQRSELRGGQGVEDSLSRSELREFTEYARDYLDASLRAQNSRFYNESPRQAQARYEAVAAENEAVWNILNSAVRSTRGWNLWHLEDFLNVFEQSLHSELGGHLLRDWVSNDAGIDLNWSRIKGIVERGVGEVWQQWEDSRPEDLKGQSAVYFRQLTEIYSGLYGRNFTKSSLENVLFRLQVLVRGYFRTEVVRAWSNADTANVYEMTGLYVGVEPVENARHRVRLTVTNPRHNASNFPYLTAEIDQIYAAAFLEDIKDVNDLFKRWPFLKPLSILSFSYKKAAFLTLFTAILSLVFGPAGGKIGLLIEFFTWSTTGVIWLDVYQIKNRTRDRLSRFTDMVQEQSGSWTVIPKESSAEESSSIHRSELRSEGGIRRWEERERAAVLETLARTMGRRGEAAGILGWSRSTLYKYEKKYRLQEEPLEAASAKSRPVPIRELKHAYVIAAMIFYSGVQRQVAKQTGISYRAVHSILSEEELELLSGSPPLELIRKYSKEIRLAFNKEEIQALLQSRFDAPEDLSAYLAASEVLGVNAQDVQSAEILNRVRILKRRFAQEALFPDEASFSEETENLRRRIGHGESLEQIIAEAAAVFMEAARFRIGQIPSDEQVLAAVAILKGNAVEMEPGEGKTLSVALAAYINALDGRGVHVHTFNSYLALRDAQEMGPVFDLLGLKVGVITDRTRYYRYDPFIRGGRKPDKKHLTMTLHEPGQKNRPLNKRDLYQSDIVYGVKDLFVFDFLQDQKINLAAQRVQRPEGPGLTVLDEGDATLLDESGTPLILAYEDPSLTEIVRKTEYIQLYQTALALAEGEDYVLDPLNENIELKPHGMSRALHFLKYIRFDSSVLTELMRQHELGNLLHQALMTKHFNERDGDYILRDGNIVLVDEFTGRVKEDYVLGNHRHQFIAAKETFEGNEASMPPQMAHGGLVTYQNYYRMMKRKGRFSMITGTLGNDGEEVSKTYGIGYVRIPQQHVSRMTEHAPVTYPSKLEKNKAVIQKVLEVHQQGSPVVVFVRRISDAHHLRDHLEAEGGIKASVIDGLDFEKEIEVLNQAGHKGQVTIATSVAGRGVNIKIDDEVRALGGLVIVMTRKSKSKRIDDQAKLRTARRGDPGQVYWFLAEEDESFKRFHGQDVSEAFLRKSRQQALFYDDAMDPYRQLFYEARNRYVDLLADKRKWTRERDLLLVDLAWQRYLMELEYAMYRRPPEGYLVQVRDGFRFVREVLKNGFERESALEEYRTIEQKHHLPLNGFDSDTNRSELRSESEDKMPSLRFQNAMRQYTAYPEVSPERRLSLEDALSKVRARITGAQPDPRKPLTITNLLRQGEQSMNLTAIHAPGQVRAAAVRARPDVKAEEIYYLEFEDDADKAIEALSRYLAFAYPGKFFDVEAGVGRIPSGDQDVVMITVHEEAGRVETVPPSGRQQPVHSVSAASAAQTFNEMTGQTPADVPKLLVTKFRSLDPRDQDRRRSELRSDDDTRPLHSVSPGYGEFVVLAGDREFQGRRLEVTDRTPVSFYFNIHTDRTLEDPEKRIKARVHYKSENSGEWKNDLEMTLYDNFENGVYRVGVTLPDTFSGELTFNYSLDGGKTWPYWANTGSGDNYQIIRSHEVVIKNKVYRTAELPEGQLKSLFHTDARMKNPWGERYWEHLETAYGAKAITAVQGGVVVAYLVYQPTETGMTVLKYAVDTERVSRLILRELWRSAQRKLRSENKEVLTAEVRFGDLKYFGKSRYQRIQKTDPSAKNEIYTVDYYSPLADGEVISAGQSIPVEYVPSEAAFLRAWARRRAPGTELEMNFDDIRARYPGLSAYRVRHVLGEYNLKPRGGYPAEVLLIRDMTDEDVDAVMNIENGAFQDPDKWSAWGFQEKPKEDETREESGGGLMDEVEEGFNRFKVVAVDEEGRVIGYLVYQIFEERIDLQKMAVAPSHRFSYIGSQMLEHVKWIMDRENLSFVSADVPAANEPVSEFFRKEGFEALLEQNEDWQKKSVTEYVYWHPEIDKSLLHSKEQAARFLRKLREMKKLMEEKRLIRLSQSPEGVLDGLTRQAESPWARNAHSAKIPFYKIKIRQAHADHAFELASFAQKQSRFAWSEDAFIEVMKRGASVLTARSAGQIIGFMVYTKQGETYQILDMAVSERSLLGPMTRRFIEHIQARDEAQPLSPLRVLWELSAEDYAAAGGNFRKRAGFTFLDEYEAKDGRAVYLLERRLRKISLGEKLFRSWAQSLEQTPVTPQAVHGQAEEFGVPIEEAERILSRFGVPVLESKPLPRQTLPEEAPYVSGDSAEDIEIRWMIRRDMPQVYRIEEASFSHPWDEQDFLRVLRQRNTIGMVAEDRDEKIIGYMVYSLYRYGHELVNFAVDPSYRGRKIGHQMVERLKEKIGSQNRYWIHAVVRETDLRAQLFWKSQGFKAVSVSRGYFEDTGEDAYMFEYHRDYESFEIASAPREILAHPMTQMRAWAQRQDLEKLKTSIAKTRYPEVGAADRENILDFYREKRLKIRMLAALPLGSGRELPGTLEEYTELSSLPRGKVREIAESLGLKIREEDYSPLPVSVRGYRVEDFHTYELKIESGRTDRRTPWTFSQFLGQVQKKDTQILTAEKDQAVVGYLAYERRGFEVNVTRTGVISGLRFRGVDQTLFRTLKEIAETEGVTQIQLDVDEFDLHTQLMLQKEGYRFYRLNHLRPDPRGKFLFRLDVESPENLAPPALPSLKDIQSLSVRYHEDAITLELKARGAAEPVILRASLEEFDFRLQEWFGLRSVVHRPWKALMWEDPETGEVETRSFLSPVEIDQIRDYIFSGIQAKAAEDSAAGDKKSADISQTKDHEDRSELRVGPTQEPENLWPKQWTEDGQISILGKGFELERAAVEKFYQEFFSGLLSGNRDAKVLDLGTGRLFVPRIGASEAVKIPNSTAEFHGVDDAPFDSAVLPQDPNIYFHQIGMEKLAEAFKAESFDAATSSFGLEYARDLPGAVEALHRVLKPGAPAAFVLHHKDSVIAEAVRESLWEYEGVQNAKVVESLLSYAQSPDPDNAERVLEAHRTLQDLILNAGERETFVLENLRDQMELILIAGEAAIPALEEMKRDIAGMIQLNRYYLDHAALFGDEEKDRLKNFFEEQGFFVSELSRFEVPVTEHPAPLLIGWKVLLRKKSAETAGSPEASSETEKPGRSELRSQENALEVFYKPARKPAAAMIDFRDLVTFTPEELREAVIAASQRRDVKFVIHNVSPEHERLLFLKKLFKPFPNVVWTQAGGDEAFHSLGARFREGGITAFARKTRDLSLFGIEALQTIRFFVLTEGRFGTFAVALSYDPEQLLFQTGVEKNGAFYEVKPFLASLAADYLSQFAFASAA